MPANAQQFLADAQNSALRRTLAGTWVAEDGAKKIRLKLDDAGAYTLGKNKGSYSVQGAYLVLMDAGENEKRYSPLLQGKDLMTESGGDFPQPLKFTRAVETTSLVKSTLQIDTQNLLVLKTGERFARVQIAIWPGQTWVIDQQLIPRFRERLAEDNSIATPDRIAAFYHLRHQQQVYTIADRLRLRRLSDTIRRRSTNRRGARFERESEAKGEKSTALN